MVDAATGAYGSSVVEVAEVVTALVVLLAVDGSRLENRPCNPARCSKFCFMVICVVFAISRDVLFDVGNREMHVMQTSTYL